MRALSILLALSSLFFATACNREFILEKQVRVALFNSSDDPGAVYINGDDFVQDFPGNFADQFYAKLRMTGGDQNFSGPQNTRTQMSVSILNKRTGRMSAPVICDFEYGRVTSIVYNRNQLISCYLN